MKLEHGFVLKKVLLLFGAILVVILFAWFVWPTKYSYHKQFAGEVLPDYGWILPRDLYDGEDPDSVRFPIYYRTRKSRFTGKKECRIRLSYRDVVDGLSPWVPAEWFTSGRTAGLLTFTSTDPSRLNFLELIWPEELKEDIATGKAGPLQATLLKSQWEIVPAGTQVITAKDGLKTCLTKDQWGLDLSMEVTNYSDDTVSFAPVFVLTDRDGLIVVPLMRKSRFWLGELELSYPVTYFNRQIPPGEKVTVDIPPITGSASRFIIVFRGENPYLESLAYGWRWQLPPFGGVIENWRK